jgi:putative DNA primase/helicase
MPDSNVAALMQDYGNPSIPPVEPIDAWTFINLNITPREYVMEPWLPAKGLVMIHAKPGVGKTWFALSCAHAIATGGRFLKWSCPAPRSVVYLDGEMAASEMQGRLRALFIEPDGAAHFHMVSFDLYDGPVPNLGTEEGQQRIAPVIDQADILVIDNLACLVADHGRADSETWDAVQPWLLSLRRRGKTVVLLHHSGKSGTQRGTSKRADALDAVIRLDRPSDATAADGARFTVTFEKARGQIGASGEPFEALLRDGEWTMQDEDRGKLELIADLTLEGKSIRKISDVTGLSRTTVNRLQKTARERSIL